MLTFSTDDLPPQDRFAYWCEERGKRAFGVTMELDPEHRADFHGRFSASAIGSAALIEMEACTYRLSRTPADIARVHDDSICITVGRRGPRWTHVCGGGTYEVVGPGTVFLGSPNHPFTLTPHRFENYAYRVLKIPLADVSLDGAVRDLASEPLPAQMQLTRLVGLMFSTLADHPPAEASAANRDVEHITRLALMARGSATRADPENRAALRTGYLYAARSILDRDFHRPQLTPLAVATELGISVRQLHMLFEPTGMTFARTLTLKRLDAAHRILVTEPHRSVIDIAYACGFESAATFYRAFRVIYGMTPSDARARAVES